MKSKKQQMTIEDLEQCAKFAIERDGKLTKKQISILVKKACENIKRPFFWEDYVSKHGVPNYGERGFSASPDAFIYYYFENLSIK
jgi:hypothetical protein